MKGNRLATLTERLGRIHKTAMSRFAGIYPPSLSTVLKRQAESERLWKKRLTNIAPNAPLRMQVTPGSAKTAAYRLPATAAWCAR